MAPAMKPHTPTTISVLKSFLKFLCSLPLSLPKSTDNNFSNTMSHDEFDDLLTKSIFDQSEDVGRE